MSVRDAKYQKVITEGSTCLRIARSQNDNSGIEETEEGQTLLQVERVTCMEASVLRSILQASSCQIVPK